MNGNFSRHEELGESNLENVMILAHAPLFTNRHAVSLQ